MHGTSSWGTALVVATQVVGSSIGKQAEDDGRCGWLSFQKLALHSLAHLLSKQHYTPAGQKRAVATVNGR
jgi:ssRNA-specific RNase YbeY (16S rRNA maturation enzyme)